MSIEAADLLDENGKIDTSKVMSQSHSVARRGDRLDAEQASEIRRRLVSGESSRELAAEFAVAQSTIRDHASGERRYPDAEPDFPPVEFDRDAWAWVASESRSDDREVWRR